MIGLLRRAGVHAAFQVGTQLLSFAAGVLIVRELSTAGYAQYAICTAVLAALLMLSDSGTSATLMARGAALLEDRERFTGLFKAAAVSRWVVSVPVVALGGMWTFFLLTANSASARTSLVCVGLTLVAAFSSLDIALQQVVHRLHLRLGVLRSLAIGQAAFRLALTLLGALLESPGPEYYLAVMAVSALLGNIFIRMASRRYVGGRTPMDRAHLPIYRSSVLKTLPMVALLIAGEQVFLGLISTTGSTEALSTFTALSRFGVVFLVLNSLVSDVAAPIVAHASSNVRAIMVRITATTGGYAALSLVLIGLVWLFSDPILGLLGARFRGLNVELTLVAAGYATYNLGYCLNFLSQARGWLSGSWFYAPLILVWALSTAYAFDLRDSRQVAVAFILQGLVFVITQIVRIYIGIRSIGRA
ncbi:oligosaccharide flippase family protein [Curtobacterium sp. ER1/6]|uniref:oligosaccharide flippase family protein n=1 Tax=Curtobacterium sp. ER1/6 TaxID=1891920 RepID=UPI0016715C43|nr:oligosaccharide flippase family protein [Curtobacterium sp. ER1/6]